MSSEGPTPPQAPETADDEIRESGRWDEPFPRRKVRRFRHASGGREMNMDDGKIWKILGRAFGLDDPDAVITPKQFRDRLLKWVDKPVKVPDGRVLVLRRRPAKNPEDDAFRVEEITQQ